MTYRQEGDPSEFTELPDDDAVDWTITRALLSANDELSRALEVHLLQTQYRSRDESDADVVKQYLDDAIEHHEQIIEDLRFARDALDYKRSQ